MYYQIFNCSHLDIHLNVLVDTLLLALQTLLLSLNCAP